MFVIVSLQEDSLGLHWMILPRVVYSNRSVLEDDMSVPRPAICRSLLFRVLLMSLREALNCLSYVDYITLASHSGYSSFCDP